MPQSPNHQRSFYFTVVLYPQENTDHAMLLEYIKSHYKSAMITHPHEFDDDPKTHTHVVFQLAKRSTVNGVNRFFGIDYCEAVENIQSMMQYLVHDTPSCIREYAAGNREKRPFAIESLIAPPDWIGYINQSSSFNMLSKLMDDASNGMTIWESIMTSPANERESLSDFVLRKGTVVHLFNQQLNEMHRRSAKE